MGVLGGQLDGFPNGRRLADDVTDIELQAVAGILCQPNGALTGATTAFGVIPQCRTSAVGATFGDGVNANDALFQCNFPYVGDPFPPTGARQVITGCVLGATATLPAPALPNTGVGSLGLTAPGMLVPGAMFLLLVGLGAFVWLPARRRRQNR